MRLLAIDTACASCSAAVWLDGAVVSSRMRLMERGQAEALMPMVAEVMREARLDFSALDLIAVTIGPGSFTGLRTGLAAARGLALARSLPVIGVTTTESIALAAYRQAAAGNRRPITVVLNSRRKDLYVEEFAFDLAPVGRPFTALPGEVARMVVDRGAILAGDATDQVMEAIETASRHADISCFPVSGSDATFVAEIAVNLWGSRSMTESSISNRLLYLRPPEAVQPADQGRLRQ